MKKSKGMAASGDQLPVNQPAVSKPVLNKRAEEYLREGGNIEDLPDPEQDKEAGRELKKNRIKK